jgi:DNA-binding MarR family transcriptional regulator
VYGIERDRLRAAISRLAGLTSTDLDTLELLEVYGPLTQRALGERLFLTSGGVTVLVDRLVRGRWVLRAPHPSDRRAVLVELHPEMPVERLAALGRFHAAIASAARELDAAERDAAAGFLESVARSAAETAEELRIASEVAR